MVIEPGSLAWYRVRLAVGTVSQIPHFQPLRLAILDEGDEAGTITRFVVEDIILLIVALDIDEIAVVGEGAGDAVEVVGKAVAGP